MNSIVNRANRQVTHIKNDLNSLREALEINSNNSKTLTSKIFYKNFSLTSLKVNYLLLYQVYKEQFVI